MDRRPPRPSPDPSKPRKQKKDRRPVELDQEEDKDYTIASLKNKLDRMSQLVRDQQHLIDCMERSVRRIRIWNISVKCAECGSIHSEFVAFVNRSVFHSSEYNRLVQRLRGLGYFIKAKGSEQIPTEAKPIDGEVSFMTNACDIRDLKIPDCVPDDIMEELKEEKDSSIGDNHAC